MQFETFKKSSILHFWRCRHSAICYKKQIIIQNNEHIEELRKEKKKSSHICQRGQTRKLFKFIRETYKKY